MKTINRTAIPIIPKQPYIDWANSFEDGAGYDEVHAMTILIPDKYGEFDYGTYLKKYSNPFLKSNLNPGWQIPMIGQKRGPIKFLKNGLKSYAQI